MEREESTGVRLKSMCRLIVVFYVNECELSDSMTFKGRAAFLSGTPLTLASHNQISWLSIVEVEIKGSVCCFSARDALFNANFNRGQCGRFDSPIPFRLYCHIKGMLWTDESHPLRETITFLSLVN